MKRKNRLFASPGIGGYFYLVADFSHSTDQFIYPTLNGYYNTGYWDSISVADALAIDTKIDDSLPNDISSLTAAGGGLWQSHNVYNADMNDTWYPAPGKGCTYEFKYNVSQPDATCALMIRIAALSNGM